MYYEKSRGDKGHPCFTPTVGLKRSTESNICMHTLLASYISRE